MARVVAQRASDTSASEVPFPSAQPAVAARQHGSPDALEDLTTASSEGSTAVGQQTSSRLKAAPDADHREIASDLDSSACEQIVDEALDLDASLSRSCGETAAGGDVGAAQADANSVRSRPGSEQLSDPDAHGDVVRDVLSEDDALVFERSSSGGCRSSNGSSYSSEEA